MSSPSSRNLRDLKPIPDVSQACFLTAIASCVRDHVSKKPLFSSPTSDPRPMAMPMAGGRLSWSGGALGVAGQFQDLQSTFFLPFFARFVGFCSSVRMVGSVGSVQFCYVFRVFQGYFVPWLGSGQWARFVMNCYTLYLSWNKKWNVEDLYAQSHKSVEHTLGTLLRLLRKRQK